MGKLLVQWLQTEYNLTLPEISKIMGMHHRTFRHHITGRTADFREKELARLFLRFGLDNWTDARKVLKLLIMEHTTEEERKEWRKVRKHVNALKAARTKRHQALRKLPPLKENIKNLLASKEE
jgi:hypothetical protein